MSEGTSYFTKGMVTASIGSHNVLSEKPSAETEDIFNDLLRLKELTMFNLPFLEVPIYQVTLKNAPTEVTDEDINKGRSNFVDYLVLLLWNYNKKGTGEGKKLYLFDVEYQQIQKVFMNYPEEYFSEGARFLITEVVSGDFPIRDWLGLTVQKRMQELSLRKFYE
jgi:hypothetical protein